MAALWYEPDLEGKGSTVTFLVLHSGPLRSLRFKKGERLLIDGLYGQDLNLKSFESVMLVAHGPGIAGVLSTARTLWECRRDNVLCRVNIFWSLDRESQGEWASEYLQSLQKLDAGNVRIVFPLSMVAVLTTKGTVRCVVRVPTHTEGDTTI